MFTCFLFCPTRPTLRYFLLLLLLQFFFLLSDRLPSYEKTTVLDITWFKYLYNISSFRMENSLTAQVSLGSPRYLLGRIRQAGGVYGNCRSCSLIISDVIYLDHGWLRDCWRVTTCTATWMSCTPLYWSLTRGKIVANVQLASLLI